MPKSTPTLGELEVAILQIIWSGQPCTERQVWDIACQQRDIGRTTVLKTIQRLEGKGVLVRVAGTGAPGKGPVQFRATFEPQRMLSSLVGRFVDQTLGGSFAPLVAYLAGQEKLSPKDLAALRAIARKLDNESP
jgi:predicted transcriptional regulator